MNLLISMLLTQGASGEAPVQITQVAQATAETVSQTAQTGNSGGFGIWGMVLYIAFFVAIFYLLIIKPQKKKDKQLKQMQEAIQIGDEVMTSSGFFGTVVDIKDDVATIEFGTNKGVRIPVKKSEIYGTKSAEKTDSKTETK